MQEIRLLLYKSILEKRESSDAVKRKRPSSIKNSVVVDQPREKRLENIAEAYQRAYREHPAEEYLGGRVDVRCQIK